MVPNAAGESETRKYMQAQIAEMEKFKWFMGEKLGHDPLKDRSLNEIYCEWIDKYGAEFRAWWEKDQVKQQGVPSFTRIARLVTNFIHALLRTE